MRSRSGVIFMDNAYRRSDLESLTIKEWRAARVVQIVSSDVSLHFQSRRAGRFVRPVLATTHPVASSAKPCNCAAVPGWRNAVFWVLIVERRLLRAP